MVFCDLDVLFSAASAKTVSQKVVALFPTFMRKSTQISDVRFVGPRGPSLPLAVCPTLCLVDSGFMSPSSRGCRFRRRIHRVACFPISCCLLHFPSCFLFGAWRLRFSSRRQLFRLSRRASFLSASVDLLGSGKLFSDVVRRVFVPSVSPIPQALPWRERVGGAINWAIWSPRVVFVDSSTFSSRVAVARRRRLCPLDIGDWVSWPSSSYYSAAA